MNKTGTLVCVGTAIVDCIIRGFDNTPSSATGFLAKSCDLAAGGEALNQAVTAQKLGLDVRLVCGIGHDSAADILVNELRRNHVSEEYLAHDPEFKTPVTVMFIDETGDRKSVTNHAHKYNFRPDKDLSYLEGADALSLGSIFRVPFNEPEILFTMVSEAKKRGMYVFADTKLPNFYQLRLEDYKASLPMVDYIFPNETEAKFYSGETEPEKMADRFLEYGIGTVIVKLGGDGCLLKNKNETIRLPGIQIPAIDATGAGDNFGAAFITAKLEGKNDAEALRFANACGALSAMSIGATTGVKNKEQIISFMKEHS